MKKNGKYLTYLLPFLYFSYVCCSEVQDPAPEKELKIQEISKNGTTQTSPQVITYIMPTDCGQENQEARLKITNLKQEVRPLECGCTTEVCCCCLNLEKPGVTILECGCVSKELCCCSECDLSTDDCEYESEDRFKCLYCNLPLKDCAFLDCTCASEEQNNCLECIKVYHELRETLPSHPNNLITRSTSNVSRPEYYATKESECTKDGQCDIIQSLDSKSLRLLTLEQAKKDTEGYQKVLIIGGTDATPGIIQKVKQVETTQSQLTSLFENLKKESEQVIKFYDYYDVLTFIDKSIAHINEFLDTFTFNISNNSVLLKKYIERVIPCFEEYDNLSDEIDFLLERCHKTSNKSKLDTIEEELTSINKRIAYLKEQYDRYKVFRIRDYQYYNTMKFHKLTRLLKDLNKVRCKILTMSEEDIKAKAESFKNSFKTTVSKIYDNLCKCKEKERRILNFMFEILEDIWVSTGKCVVKMKSLKTVLDESSATIPTFAE